MLEQDCRDCRRRHGRQRINDVAQLAHIFSVGGASARTRLVLRARSNCSGCISVDRVIHTVSARPIEVLGKRCLGRDHRSGDRGQSFSTLACAPSVAPTQRGRDFGSAMSGRVVLDDTIRERAARLRRPARRLQRRQAAPVGRPRFPRSAPSWVDHRGYRRRRYLDAFAWRSGGLRVCDLLIDRPLEGSKGAEDRRISEWDHLRHH
jgi:hypothetical protein